MQYFGSNIEGVAESRVEAKMSWVEVDRAGWRWVQSLVIPRKIVLEISAIICSTSEVSVG